MRKLNRREFIEAIAAISAGIFIGGCGSKQEATTTHNMRGIPFNAEAGAPVYVSSDKGPAGNTRAALEALCGKSSIIRKGDFVVIKPNIAWNRPPSAAATTNPEVVAELVKMCKEAGAGKILVIDHVIDKPAEAVLGFTGIQEAAEKAGAEVRAAQNESDYRTVDLPKGKLIKSDTCIKDILKADVFINAPIAKSHSATQLTLGMKNLMGCNWDRQAWHDSSSLDQCIVDYASAVRPDLTVLDATRILLTNGPKGPGQTKDPGKVVVGTDPVAVDAYAATLFGLKPKEVGHVALAAESGLGSLDLTKVKVV